MSARPDYWAFWSEDAKRTGSPLYARLAEGIGGDADLKALAARAQKGQPPANMILGAVHFLLLRGAEHPLSRFYPTVGGTGSVEADDLFPLFADFVARHRSAIERLIESRVTNTNEVGRSAVLHAGFRAVAAEAGAPLNLIEIGPSAGLNMIWDRFGVRYTRVGETVASLMASSPLMIECELRGPQTPPLGPAPAIGRRVGLERHPVNLEEAEDRDWLRALAWPDRPARLERLDRAIALFRDAVQQVEIRRGDALDSLLDTVRAMPEREPLCVYHTIALYQFSTAMKETVEDLLTVAGLRRPVWRLAYEFDGTDYPLALIRYHDGTRAERRLALCQPHGAWLEWLG